MFSINTPVKKLEPANTLSTSLQACVSYLSKVLITSMARGEMGGGGGRGGRAASPAGFCSLWTMAAESSNVELSTGTDMALLAIKVPDMYKRASAFSFQPFVLSFTRPLKREGTPEWVRISSTVWDSSTQLRR